MIVHAPNVHHGGAKNLLTAVLRALPAGVKGHLLVDTRLDLPTGLPDAMQVWTFSPRISARFRAEWRLKELASSHSNILCFGNLPPLFRVAGRVSVFLHNWYLVGPSDLSSFSAKKRWQTRMERRWLQHCLPHAAEVVVQTQTMRRHIDTLSAKRTAVRVLPFVAAEWLQNDELAQSSEPKMYDFLYLSSGCPHKNHATLFDAWTFLAEDGLFPSLAVTIADDDILSGLNRRIEQLRLRRGIRIDNLGRVPAAHIPALYRRSRRLVFPSLFESFGLPLIEAQKYGLSIVAPELDYVRDIVTPEQTFDPHSPRSLARAIERCLSVDRPKEPIVDAGAFLTHWLNPTRRAANLDCKDGALPLVETLK